jgi:Txe/YoeB family toxin of Txe-Axe toxin-antitoxin module
MIYKFTRSTAFHRAFNKLSHQRQEQATKIFKDIFQKNPFDPILGVHKINRLSDKCRKTIYTAQLDGNFRMLFAMDDQRITCLDIGTHQIYK